jgi:hypothetical protein
MIFFFETDRSMISFTPRQLVLAGAQFANVAGRDNEVTNLEVNLIDPSFVSVLLHIRWSGIVLKNFVMSL